MNCKLCIVAVMIVFRSFFVGSVRALCSALTFICIVFSTLVSVFLFYVRQFFSCRYSDWFCFMCLWCSCCWCCYVYREIPSNEREHELFFPSVVFSLFFHFVRHFIDFQSLNMHTTVRNYHLVLFINREMCGNNVKTELPAYPNVTLLKDSKMANISKYRCIHQMQRHLYQFSACT